MRSDIIKLLSERTRLSEDTIRDMDGAQLTKLISSNNIPDPDPSQLPGDNSMEQFQASIPKENWLKRTWNKTPNWLKISGTVAIAAGGGYFLGALIKGKLAMTVLGAAVAFLVSCKKEKAPFDAPEKYKSFVACYCKNIPMYTQLQRCVDNGGNVPELKQIFNDNKLQLDSIIKHKHELKDMVHKIEAKASGQLNNEQQKLLAQMLATTVLIDEKDNESIGKLKEFLEMVYNKFDNLNPEDTETYTSILNSITKRCDSSYGSPAVTASFINDLIRLDNMDNSSIYMAYMARNPYNRKMLDLFLSVPNHSEGWKTLFNELIANTATMELGPQTSMDLILSDTVNLPENMQLSIYKILKNTDPSDLDSLETFLRLASERTLSKPQMQPVMDDILSQSMPCDVHPILAQIDASSLDNKEKTTANGVLLAQVLNNRNSFNESEMKYTLQEIAMKVYDNVQNSGVSTFPYNETGYITNQQLCDRLQPIINGSATYDENTIKEIFLCLNLVLAVSAS